LADAGRFTVVVTNPAELPVQAWRPAIGLWKFALIVPLYPPTASVAPVRRMSWNAPLLMLASSTIPSNVFSRLLFRRNVIVADADVIVIGLETRFSSDKVAGSFENAEFAPESDTGVGVPLLDVAHAVESTFTIAVVAVQPAGSAGTVTPSKF
jgi:hypothetical protein